MGWRERDYARWTDAERRRFVGAQAAHGRVPARGFGLRQGVSLGVVASAAVLALGHLPQGHPLVPSFHFSLAAPRSTPNRPAPGRIAVPRHGRLGSTLTVHGRLAGADGRIVVVEGAYREGWTVVGRARVRGGRYAVDVPLVRPGLFHLRVVYPDGSRAVGSIRVR